MLLRTLKIMDRVLAKRVEAQLFSAEELPHYIEQLFIQAFEKRNNAQAPYSHYHVGAAAWVQKPGTNDGAVMCSGVNVERDSWTQTTHAEQNSIDTSVTELGPCRVLAMAVVGAPASEKMSWPPPPYHWTRLQQKLNSSARHVVTASRLL